MRIKVIGDCDAAKVLRGYLRKSDCAVVSSLPDYTVQLEENSGNHVVVDSIDCLLERNVLNQIGELGVPAFILKREGGVQSDAEIKITYPPKYQHPVELGLYRALTHEKRDTRTRAGKAIRKYAAPVALWLSFVLLGSLVKGDELPRGFTRVHPILFQPTNFPIVRFWDGTTIVNAGDSANNAIRVNVVAGGSGGGSVTQGAGAGAATNYWNNRITDGTNFIPFPLALGGSGGFKIECLSGCGGAAAFADAAAFTFGTSSIGNIGAVVDDVGTNVVAENSAGAPRMNTNRILYAAPTDATGTIKNPEVARISQTGAENDVDVLTLPAITGTVTANAGTNLNTSALALDATLTNRFPAGSTPATGESNAITTTRVGAFNFVYNGTTWDRAAGTSASGTKVFFSNTTTDNDVDVTSIVPPTLTKGTQGATGFSTQDLKDAGRSTIMFTVEFAPTAVAEALLTLTKSVDGAATSTTSSYTITNGKRLRIGSISFVTENTLGVNNKENKLRMRYNTAGAVTTGSALQGTWVTVVTTGVTTSGLSSLMSFPDGVEFLGDGTKQIGFTNESPNWVTGAQTSKIYVTIAAYEY